MAPNDLHPLQLIPLLIPSHIIPELVSVTIEYGRSNNISLLRLGYKGQLPSWLLFLSQITWSGGCQIPCL